MKRNLLLIGSVAALGFAIAIAGTGDIAKACDKATKTATAATTSCSSKEAKTTTALKKGSTASIKSAMVAPGAAGSLVVNTAAVGAQVAGQTDCGWCPEGMKTAAAGSACASMTAAQCAAMKASGACTEGATAIHTASTATGTAMKATLAAGSCARSTTTTASMAASGCAKSMNTAVLVSADGGSCCDSKNAQAKTAGTSATKEHCADEKTTTASLKGTVDEIAGREGKRVVLAGTYVCGHCTLQKTADCSPMLKTTDGKVYPLLKSARVTEMKGQTSEKGLEVAGVVRKIDGVKYVEVKSYKLL